MYFKIKAKKASVQWDPTQRCAIAVLVFSGTSFPLIAKALSKLSLDTSGRIKVALSDLACRGLSKPAIKRLWPNHKKVALSHFMSVSPEALAHVFGSNCPALMFMNNPLSRYFCRRLRRQRFAGYLWCSEFRAEDGDL